MGARQVLIAVKTERIFPGKSAQNYVPAESPLTIVQKIPVSAPDLDVYTCSGDSVKQALTSWFPSTKKSDGTAPSRIVRGQGTVHFITISERHIDQRLPERLVLLSLIRLAIKERIKCTYRS